MKTDQTELERITKSIGGLLDLALPEGVGYVLSIFGMKKGSEMNYMSNCPSVEMVKYLRELAARLEEE